MDIEKDSNREAFERLPLAELAIKSEYVYYNQETNSYWPNEDFCPSDAPETMNFAWEAWQAAKAQAIPDGFVLVPKKSIEHWYFDEGEYLWMDEPDNWLCDMDVGEVQEVEHKEYIVTESNTLYATKVWDAENQAVSSWEFFSSKDDAEKAAEYCKAMIEASQEPAND